jgi:hypothetical protein
MQSTIQVYIQPYIGYTATLRRPPPPLLPSPTFENNRASTRRNGSTQMSAISSSSNTHGGGSSHPHSRRPLHGCRKARENPHYGTGQTYRHIFDASALCTTLIMDWDLYKLSFKSPCHSTQTLFTGYCSPGGLSPPYDPPLRIMSLLETRKTTMRSTILNIHAQQYSWQ